MADAEMNQKAMLVRSVWVLFLQVLGQRTSGPTRRDLCQQKPSTRPRSLAMVLTWNTLCVSTSPLSLTSWSSIWRTIEEPVNNHAEISHEKAKQYPQRGGRWRIGTSNRTLHLTTEEFWFQQEAGKRGDSVWSGRMEEEAGEERKSRTEPVLGGNGDTREKNKWQATRENLLV